MPKVDFYTIQQNSQQDRDIFACRFVEKVFNQGHKIYIHTDSEAESQAMDDLLWSFRTESFLPHAIVGLIDDEDVPILIGHTDECSGPRDVLVNLSQDIPAFHSEFQRIAEIVINDETVKTNLRTHWKHFQELGYEVQGHQI